MEAPTNANELYPIPGESSQVDVGEMEQQREDQKEERTKGWTDLLNDILHSTPVILSSLTSSLFNLGRKLWHFWYRSLKWLWHWLKVLVEGEH
ncbi:hypothetical protein I314_02688 [Cryptococcus bacillisporus CA1873]|uniref:Peroxin domain-containing protein n=1 Tax=Cryptococcus bacillisporus CA1873 TaxID=1296111 RepID=A0ABR5BC60_CRYGA|nr:hypothetical protein I314_02688 [Cryptococcus bacillisporus CA1873]|eukprot:KIR63907.1 hypothetical protein I314_02688 [Cryptococcus gattii CA1873]